MLSSWPAIKVHALSRKTWRAVSGVACHAPGPIYSSDERLQAAINVALGELGSYQANVLSCLLLLAWVARSEPRHSHAAFRKHKRLSDGGVSCYCIHGNRSTARVPNKVHRPGAQLLDKCDEVGDMLIDAELAIAAPWLWMVVP
jgi:hypothetical protein